ncbi:MAG: cell division ATP-binding protein FtsE, partial [Pseudomonadota bacterium]|nr:cell division ATP-binding protein FtsE [Pseudomonadota bacterium]
MIRFENVGMCYEDGHEVIHDIAFRLLPGSFHFLTGASGAGKTTLMRLMSMTLSPSRGSIRLFGRDTATLTRPEMPTLRQRIGMVFQEFRLLDHLSAFDNVALPLRVTGRPEVQVRRHVEELLDWVGLGDHMQAPPHSLSGGQQQRVAIARAVINRPGILLADEPTGNIDDALGLKLLHMFDELNRLGTTVVIATHNESLISRFDHPRLPDAGADG